MVEDILGAWLILMWAWQIQSVGEVDFKAAKVNKNVQLLILKVTWIRVVRLQSDFMTQSESLRALSDHKYLDS